MSGSSHRGRPGGSAGRRLLAAGAVTLALAAGCRTVPPPVPRGARPVALPAPATADAAAGILASARALVGAPYRYSGADPRGFDCSGLTSYLFAGAGVGLPRTTAAQAGAGRWVPLDELAAGDLVFFAGAGKPDHVGLVVSAGGETLKMIHASSSHGVIETEVLSSPYWLGRLRFGRRVLP